MKKDMKDDHSKDMMKKDGNENKLGMQKKQMGNSKRTYHHTHHNAMHHQGKVAAGGFTTEHMESFIHLGTYALGALGNQHGLTPDAPRDPAEEEEGASH